MTIRTRLTWWYAAILMLSLVLIGGGTYREIAEQMRHGNEARTTKRALGEAGEMVFQVGLPAVVLGLAGGWWLTRRALDPLTKLTDAVENTNERNLAGRLPRSGNGDELDRLTEVFNRMLARLDGSFSRVRDFTLHASHELKTPLTILRGQAELALREESANAAQREFLASQLDELHRLTRIVDSLTLLAKADAGLLPLVLSPVRVDDLVRDHVADAQILAQASGLKVELAACEELSVPGDPPRLRQLLLNLADNAIKYNRPGGVVSMSLQRAGDSAEIVIANTGPGIPAESLPRVFDRFYRHDPSGNGSVEGCGLGLSIAQWIVSAHHGTIQIASVPSTETTVTVRLPLFGTKAA